MVVTHAQLYQIFRDLSTVANMVKNEGLKLREQASCQSYAGPYILKRLKSERPTYGINFISIENLGDPEIIELLKKKSNI